MIILSKTDPGCDVKTDSTKLITIKQAATRNVSLLKEEPIFLFPDANLTPELLRNEFELPLLPGCKSTIKIINKASNT